MDPDLWTAVTAAIAAGQAGETGTASADLVAAWAACGTDDHALRCIVAHYLADLQAEPADELMWDQRALEAHRQVADEDLHALGLTSAAAMLPSLHLNLGDDWLRLGDTERAAEHLRLGRDAEHHLAEDPYGDMIRRGLAGLAERVETHAAG